MKAKLIVEGREFPIEIQDPELQKLLKSKKTGYERVEERNFYYYADSESDICTVREHKQYADDVLYELANYYSDRTVAENNARADKLMRQLRRFAVEHRENHLFWAKDYCNFKWSITYDYKNNRATHYKHWDVREAFIVYFDSEETVKLAIETFHDELIWYFTEYKDSL